MRWDFDRGRKNASCVSRVRYLLAMGEAVWVCCHLVRVTIGVVVLVVVTVVMGGGSAVVFAIVDVGGSAVSRLGHTFLHADNFINSDHGMFAGRSISRSPSLWFA